MILVAIVGDFDAPHEFHHEERPSGFGCPGLQHLGNVGVIHQGQRLTLGFKAGNDVLGVHPQLDDLEGDLAADGFLLLGHVNHAATAFTDLLEQFVAANALSNLLDGRSGYADGSKLAGLLGGGRRSFLRQVFQKGAKITVNA